MSLPGADKADQPRWRRACICESGECLEVAWHGASGVVLVRDSKEPAGGTLSPTATQWRSLLSGIKSGQYSHLSR